MAASELVCASWEPGHDNCLKNGRYSCKGCLLVTPDCKSPLGRKNWLPAWFLENRKPSFIGPEIGKPFGARKHLWGNVPAIDVLGLGANEGDEYGRDLRLLFAASGDLRNLVKTIAQLPSSYSHSIEATINDRDLDVMARNVILLLIALVVQDVEEKIDCMIHVWYSVLIRKTDNDLVQHHIRPLIEAVCAKIKDKDPGSLLGEIIVIDAYTAFPLLTESLPISSGKRASCSPLGPDAPTFVNQIQHSSNPLTPGQ
ncbi:hypothetical protein G6O67_007888 [Ophiocordyceps sinensis]|uniref:DUF4470 domain-containing protein n=1 Tax=Ophiocordyceps sinensis TaxID=72228 RepID=A0A8H4LRM8_9HYPO|nr:hypothetical protein G6O67_007888 [Ophiocordyceps sinensis]